MTQIPTQVLKQTLRQRLNPAVFAPNPHRLLWFAVHGLGVIFAYSLAVFWGQESSGLNLALLIPLSLLVGMNFGGLAFVAHEALHGAITRHRRLRNLAGRLGFLPFLVSPRLWIAWHNRIHHGNTNVPRIDPDAYPSLDEYRSNRAARLAVLLGAPRSRKWRGVITFLLGFSLQSLQVLIYARKRGHLSARHHRFAIAETVLSAVFWACLLALFGPGRFLFLYVIPIIIANVIVMSYIVTNHSLNPLVEESDPLASTLSVTVPRWYETYSLQFGYHVEHHLFPAMSHVHGPKVRALLLELAPERYHTMPLGDALARIMKTPRVYERKTVLFDPDSGERSPTLSANSGREPPVEDAGFAPSSAASGVVQRSLADKFTVPGPSQGSTEDAHQTPEERFGALDVCREHDSSPVTAVVALRSRPPSEWPTGKST